MKSFNLDDALAGKPVVDKDNNEVEQLKLYDTIDGFKLVFTINNKLHSCLINETTNELFMKTTSIPYCVSLLKAGDSYVFKTPYLASEYALDEAFTPGFIKTIQFTIDE